MDAKDQLGGAAQPSPAINQPGHAGLMAVGQQNGFEGGAAIGTGIEFLDTQNNGRGGAHANGMGGGGNAAQAQREIGGTLYGTAANDQAGQQFAGSHPNQLMQVRCRD